MCLAAAAVLGILGVGVAVIVEALLGAVDYLVLKLLAQVAEMIAVTCNADDEVFVFLRIGLGSQQRLAVDDVELDMVAVHVEG